MFSSWFSSTEIVDQKYKKAGRAYGNTLHRMQDTRTSPKRKQRGNSAKPAPYAGESPPASPQHQVNPQHHAAAPHKPLPCQTLSLTNPAPDKSCPRKILSQKNPVSDKSCPRHLRAPAAAAV